MPGADLRSSLYRDATNTHTYIHTRRANDHSPETVQVTSLRKTLASSSKSECASCHQQGHVGSKTYFQQNPPVLTGDVS